MVENDIEKQEDDLTSKEYILKLLKQVDDSLNIYSEMIQLIDIFDFYEIIHVYLKESYKYKQIKRLNNGDHANITIGERHNILFNTMVNYFLKYCFIDRNTLYILKDDRWTKICDNPQKKLLVLINAILSNEIDFNKQDQFNKKMIDFITVDDYNSVIQLNNYHIIEGKIKNGTYYQSLPNYRIHQTIDEDFERDQSQPIEELLLHLSKDDKDTCDRLVDDLSMCLCNDSNFIRKNGKFIRFYGPSANNGKSTLLNMLEQTLGSQNVISFSTSNLAKYELETVTSSLVGFDPDEDGSKWSSEVSRNIKSIVTSDKLLVRKIYTAPVQITPITTLIAATNNMPKTEDKSAGIPKRLDWFHIDKQLVKTDEWFNQLNSEESIHYFINLLFHTYQSLLERGQLNERSQMMINTEKMFNEANNSAYAFLMNVDLEEDVNNHSVRDVKSYYTRFCEENDLNQLGANKFNTELIKLGYKQKNIRAQYLKLGHHHGQDVIDQVEDEIDDNKVVKAWVKA